MGSNRRYADAIDRRMSARADGIVMRDYEPVSLAKQELEFDTQRSTRVPVSIAVQAGERIGPSLFGSKRNPSRGLLARARSSGRHQPA